MAAPVYASQGAGQVAGVTSMALDKPSGLAVGDLMLAMLNVSINGAPTWTYPSGWTKAGATSWQSASQKQIEVAWKIATSGDVAASTFTFSVTGTSVEGIAACILRITGAHQTSPINANANQVTTTGSAGNLPDLTTTVDNCLIIHLASQFYSSSPSGAQWPNAAPSGETLFGGVPDASVVSVSWQSAGVVQTTAGAFSSKTVSAPSISSGNDFQAVTLAIAPPSSATQTLAPLLLSNSKSFQAPTVTRGAVHLSPSLLQSTSSFASATVTQTGGSQSLSPSLLTAVNTFAAPVVTVGALTLRPGLLGTANTIFGPTVARGLAQLSPGLFSGTPAFYPPTLTQTGGMQTLRPARIDSAGLFHAPTVTGGVQTVTPALLVNESAILLPAVANENTPPQPGGAYPLAIQGAPSTVRGRLAGGGSVSAAAVAGGAHVIASFLKGRP